MNYTRLQNTSEIYRNELDFYRKIYLHLTATNQGFCFTEKGLISLEDCLNKIK